MWSIEVHQRDTLGDVVLAEQRALGLPVYARLAGAKSRIGLRGAQPERDLVWNEEFPSVDVANSSLLLATSSA